MMKKFEFSVNLIPLLDLKVGCDVTILETDNHNQILIELVGDETSLKNFQVERSDNTICIKQKGLARGGINISSSGGVSVISSGRNISVSRSAGRIFVNGVEINAPDYAQSFEPPKLIIFAPSLNVNAKLFSSSQFISKAKIKHANLLIDDGAVVELTAESLELNSSDSSEVKAIIGGGTLALNVSDSAEVEIEGTWSQAEIKLSDSGDIVTRGVCLGDYRVKAKDSGTLIHHGTAGQVQKSVSDSASVKVYTQPNPKQQTNAAEQSVNETEIVTKEQAIECIDQIEQIVNEAASSCSLPQSRIIEEALDYINRAKKEAHEEEPYKPIILINLERAVSLIKKLG